PARHAAPHRGAARLLQRQRPGRPAIRAVRHRRDLRRPRRHGPGAGGGPGHPAAVHPRDGADRHLRPALRPRARPSARARDRL
ncbi:MAG: hypothetical protein AVDCRST_MAG57-2594, partial [uncultured Blastococcus sp.]